MKQVFLIVSLLTGIHSFSQEIKIIPKITKDSISIKWLPTNFDQLVLMTKGVKISRIESTATSNVENLNFSSAKIWEIAPLNTRYKSIDNLPDEGSKTVFEPLFTPNLVPQQKNVALGTIAIENVTNKTSQFILGNCIVDKEFSRDKQYIYKIEFEKYKPLFIAINPASTTRYPLIQDVTISLDKRKIIDLKWDAKPLNKYVFGFNIEHTIDTTIAPTLLTPKPYLPFTSSSEIKNKKEIYRHETPTKGKTNFYRVIGIDPFGIPEIPSTWQKIYVPNLIEATINVDTVFSKGKERIIKGNIYPNTSTISQVQLLKSLDKDKNFTLIETRPLATKNLEFTINGEVLSGDNYYYKLAAINKDDTVFSLPYYFFTLDQEPPTKPLGLAGKIDSSGIVTLTWTNSIEKDIQGYKIFRANHPKEDFVEKTTDLIKENTFSDTLALNNLTSEVYYYLQAVDNNFNQSPTSDTLLLLKPDTIAPSAAVIAKIIATNNSLQLNWINSESTDLEQNTLLRNTGLKTDTVLIWKQKTRVEFIDTSLIPGQYYAYTIHSCDKAKNCSNSTKYSIFYEPGYRNPLKEVSAKATKETKKITITWEKPNDEVYSYQILKTKTGKDYLPVKTIFDANQTSYEDKQINLNTTYFYAIKYVNKQGIQSKPVNIQLLYQ